MKWSSSSNSTISNGNGNGSIVALSLHNHNANSASTNGPIHNQSGGNGITRPITTAVRRHASDRRSIFYTNPDDMEIFIKNHNNKKMSPSLSTNRQHSADSIPKMNASTQSSIEADQVQRRKCENLVSYFTNQIGHLNKELEIEKQSRDIHLAKIAKALLCFEAKLRSDQKQIRQQLCEKDSQLNRLTCELTLLRKRYGIKGDEIKVDQTAQYCLNCRNQYYIVNKNDVGIQVTKRDLNCNDDHHKENKLLPTSSSEDGLVQVFSSEARRSKRYMSKRTSGTFREYLKSRNIELAVNNDVINRNACDTSADRPVETEQSTVSMENQTNESFSRKGSMRRTTKPSVLNKCDKNGNKIDDNYDTTIANSIKTNNESNELHRHANGDIITTTTTTTISNSNRNSKRTTKSAAVENNAFLKKYDNEVDKPKTQFESNDDWYASASDMDDSDGAVLKPYGYNAVNPVLECVNQILLQQSMDGIMDSCANADEKASVTQANAKNACNNVVETSPPKESNPNTLKKRVHFSTQNSMVQVPRSDSSSSIYQRGPSNSSVNMCSTKESNVIGYATVYSNEYEPIGSENNSTNHYVDMDSKLGDDRPLNDKSKTAHLEDCHSVRHQNRLILNPPPLPPKPANLLKFRQISKMPAYPLQAAAVKQIDNESEPDYCSIGDIQEAVKSVQIVADVHKNADDDISSHASEETKTDITDETFADIPKLPNVQAIISPKRDPTQNKVITHDNYVTKTSQSPPRAKPAILPTKAAVANLLSELNKSKTKLNNQMQKSNAKLMAELEDTNSNTKKNPMKKITMTTISESTVVTSPIIQPQSKSSPIIKHNEKVLMPIQAEFDWYNLDVEYGKMLPTNLMENGKDLDTDEPKNFGIEYNLDAEFSLTSCSLSSDNNSSIESSGSTIHFVPITVTEDSSNEINNGGVGGILTTDSDINIIKTNSQQSLNPTRLKKLINKSSASAMPNNVNDKSFDSFLEQTGLVTKPLPQKRKIFYNAPYV